MFTADVTLSSVEFTSALFSAMSDFLTDEDVEQEEIENG